MLRSVVLGFFEGLLLAKPERALLDDLARMNETAGSGSREAD